MMRSIWVTLLALGLATACAKVDAPSGSPRNLLVVCFDTVRFDSFSAASHGEPDDPRSAWAPRALRFGNAQAPAPWTVPSVASLLTGLYPTGHGAGRFAAPLANLDQQIPGAIRPSVLTLAERLRTAGHRTVAFVAHPWFESGYGLERGFDDLRMEPSRTELAGHASKWIGSHARGPRAQPFFAYLHFMDAHRHLSWSAEERRHRRRSLFEPSAQQAMDAAPGGTCNDRSAPSCAHYLAYVQSIAEQLDSLAQVLRALDENGRLEDTIVVLYSDHGEEFGDHASAQRERGVDPRGIYGFGHGHSLYQEQLHVPLWIWHPRIQGREVLGPVSLLDVLPTVLEWLAVEDGGGLDGQSLAGWLADREPPPEPDRPLFATGIAYGPEQFSVVRFPWKRIRWGKGDGELFHLLEDPGELAPRAEPEIASRFEELILARFGDVGRAETQVPDLSRERIERLQEIGYLEDVPPERDE